MVFAVFAQQDTIANAGFEQWTSTPAYDDPVGWTTLNSAGTILGAELAFRATGPAELHSGDAAIKLVTAEVQFFGMTPSILTTGEINTTTQVIEGGWPMSSRPTSFGGWFRFDPIGDDTAFVNITLNRWNSVSGMTELVGKASATVTNTDSVFTNVELTLDYETNEIPDTVLIVIGSGQLDAQEGSALFVDDLYYMYPSNIATPASVGLSIYPNPTNDVLNITSTAGMAFSNAVVIGLDGRVIQSTVLNSSNARMDVSDLKTGAYIIELQTADRTVVRQRFMRN